MATLELYLIRHGVAAERGEDYPDDSKRPLTSDGIARLRKEAKALSALDIGFDQILSSPLVRARQTADVFAEEMKSKPPIANTDALTPALALRSDRFTTPSRMKFEASVRVPAVARPSP